MIYPILLLALGLRLILINQSFWLDEGASLVIARQDLFSLISSLTADFHPPLFYLFLHYWLKLGITAEWFLRLPNILFGVGSVWGVYLILHKLKLERSALLSALLLAINPFHIYYSQELRMFSLSAALAVCSWLCLVRASHTAKWRAKAGIFFFLTTLANLYTFYGAVFNLAAQAIYIFISRRRHLKPFVISSLTAVIFFLPWLTTLEQQFQGSKFLRLALPGWSQLSGELNFKSLFLIPAKFTLGRINFSTSPLYQLTAAIITLYILALTGLSLLQKHARLFLVWLVVPLLLAIGTSLFAPVLGYWRYLYLVPPFIVLIVLGIGQLPPRLRLVNLAVVAATFILANLLFWLTPAYQRENWRQSLDFVLEQLTPNSLVLFAFSDAFAPVRWYSPSLPYAAPLENFNLSTSDLDAELSVATLNKSQIFYFEYLSPLTDPAGNISTWLSNAGYLKEKGYNFPGVGLIHHYRSSP